MTPDRHVEVPVPEEAKRLGIEALNRFNELSDAPLAESANATVAVLQAAAPFIAAKAVEEKELENQGLRDQLGEAHDRHAQLEDLASLVRPGGPQPDYDAVADDLLEIATTLDKLPEQAIKDCDRFMEQLARAEDERDQAVQQERERLRGRLVAQRAREIRVDAPFSRGIVRGLDVALAALDERGDGDG